MAGRPLRRARRDALASLADSEVTDLARKALRNASDTDLLVLLASNGEQLALSRTMSDVRQVVRDRLTSDRRLCEVVLSMHPRLLNNRLAQRGVGPDAPARAMETPAASGHASHRPSRRQGWG